ncbi:MAG: SH3 domain-containing protein [Candidatus Limiplasma sp.]|nr:SH3 domain-containing protein [Candidatus Limiplasma sp.]
MILWYMARYRAEKRELRRMTRELWTPWTGRALLAVVATALLAVGLAVFVPPALADAQYVVTVRDTCNVREEPGTESVDAGDLYAGDVVTGTDYRDGWVLVLAPVEAGSGWVRADLLTLDGVPTGRYTNATGGRVHLRRAPDGKHAGWLEAGRGVDVIRWCDVGGTAWACTSGGYIRGDCLEAADAGGEETP